VVVVVPFGDEQQRKYNMGFKNEHTGFCLTVNIRLSYFGVKHNKVYKYGE
jgi:hypothetical protein